MRTRTARLWETCTLAWDEWRKKSRSYLWLLGFSFLLAVLTFVLPLIRLLPVVQEGQFIPLHYNIFFGIDQFGPWTSVFVLPLIGFVCLLINLLVAVHWRREAIISYLLLVTTAAVELILAFAMVFIILLTITV
jgi:hypothetical protein